MFKKNIFVVVWLDDVGTLLLHAPTVWRATQLPQKHCLHCLHCLHLSAQVHGKSPKPSPCRQCRHDLHCPPLKYYTVRIVRLVAAWPVAGCCLLGGGRGGPAAKGHGSGGATNKIFYSPHCPHDPQIFLLYSAHV